MDKKVVLFRQIFPDWFKDGILSKQAFNPTDAHEFKLSSYSDEVFNAESSFEHYTKTMHKESCGCLGITNEEYLNQELISTRDNHNFDGHVSTDFSPYGTNQKIKKAKILRDIAFNRGWLFKLPENIKDENDES